MVSTVLIGLSPNATKYGIPENNPNPSQLRAASPYKQGFGSIVMSRNRDFVTFFDLLPVIGLGANPISTASTTDGMSDTVNCRWIAREWLEALRQQKTRYAFKHAGLMDVSGLLWRGFWW